MNIASKKTISLLGEVVEAYRDGDKQILKVILKSGNVDIVVSNCETLHLGDTLKIEATIKIKNVAQPETSAQQEINLSV